MGPVGERKGGVAPFCLSDSSWTPSFTTWNMPDDDQLLTPPLSPPRSLFNARRRRLSNRRSISSSIMPRSVTPTLTPDPLPYNNPSQLSLLPTSNPHLIRRRCSSYAHAFDVPALPLPVTEAVYSFRLLEALRSGDEASLRPFLKRDAQKRGPVRELTSPLHLAVRCAECE